MQRERARRRGAIVLATSVPQGRSDLWLAAILLVGLLASVVMSASAQGQDNPPPQPPGSPSVEPSNPGAGITGGTGVIRPPAQVDPGIKAKPPVPPSALPMPVIPPPGTPGGNTSVQPK